MACLEITTVIGCSLRCSVCPQDTLIKAYFAGRHKPGIIDDRLLSLDNFKTIVDKLPEYVTIDFSGFAEPFLNQDCTEMLRYTLEKGRPVNIYTSLAGMTKDTADTVCEIIKKHNDKIYSIVIHLPDANNYMRGWKKTEEWEYAFYKFFELYKERKPAGFRYMTMDRKNRVHPDIPVSIVKKIGFRQTRIISRAGNVIMREKSRGIENPVLCKRSIFLDRNVLLPNGDVVLCCMDYGMKHILGNLLREDYEEIRSKNPVYALNSLFGANRTLCKSCEESAEYQYDKKIYNYYLTDRKRQFLRDGKYLLHEFFTHSNK
jgi:hypothetical protein